MASRVCKFVKRGKGYHARLEGASYGYVIRKSAMFPGEWVVLQQTESGGVSREYQPSTKVAYRGTLQEAKKVVAHELGCRMPERKGR